MSAPVAERPDTPSAAGAASLPALLLQRAAARPHAVALREKRLGRWEQYTWEEYATRAAHVGLGLVGLGVRPGDRVAVQGENRPAWLLADLAIQGIGATTVGVYPTSPPAEVEHVLGHSGSVVLLAEDEEQLDKAMAVRSRLPHLRRIVVADTRGVRRLASDPMLTTFAELEELGRLRPVEDWHRMVAALEPEAVAVLAYTPGTTGPPKGAMLTHAGLVAAGSLHRHALPARPDDEVLSYLPLCHVAERLVSVVGALHAGHAVNFGGGGESFLQDLREVQPTLLLGVPRVWEKLFAAVENGMAGSTWLKRRQYRFWAGRCAPVARRRMRSSPRPLDGAVALLGWLLVFRSLRAKLGLSRVRIALSGTAPIAPQVVEFFRTIGVPVREVYGQTEGAAVATCTPEGDVRAGAVGTPLPGVELRVDDDGDILVRHAAVFAGYFGDPQSTAATVDAEGWLRSGDVGRIDADGFLSITGRRQDIVVTAAGGHVSPSEIENRLKVSPFVKEAVVIGDRRPYLTALIGIELDSVASWATRTGIAFTTYRDLTEKPAVRRLVEQWVDTVNAELAQVGTVERFALLPRELEHEEGELTAVMQVRRAAVASRFAGLIEDLYR